MKTRWTHRLGTKKFDGVRVSRWIVPWLREARKRGWTGRVTSGFRSKRKQRRLCRSICGNPNGCPGQCAAPGSSMHNFRSYPRGAVDVTEALQLEGIFKEIGAPLVLNHTDNCGGAGICHFSHLGN